MSKRSDHHLNDHIIDCQPLRKKPKRAITSSECQGNMNQIMHSATSNDNVQNECTPNFYALPHAIQNLTTEYADVDYQNLKFIPTEFPVQGEKHFGEITFAVSEQLIEKEISLCTFRLYVLTDPLR
eukprot:618270_1